MAELKLSVAIERKQAELPAFVVVPAAKLAAWKLEGTTTVEGTLDGVALGRRSLKRWDAKRWFLELPKGVLEKLGKGPGDRARLAIEPASDELPAELRELVEKDKAARARWEGMSEAQRRMLREHVLSAKGSATRERRAREALLPAAAPRPARVRGLAAEPKSIAVRILARRLPGRTCGLYSEIAVGFVDKTTCPPSEMVPGDARGAQWETAIEVRAKDGRPAFRGPAVNGPPSERFLYLTWIGRKLGAPPAMFRRAKLRLDAIPPDVLASALESGRLTGRLELTAADGTPLCASVKPPAIAWES